MSDSNLRSGLQAWIEGEITRLHAEEHCQRLGEIMMETVVKIAKGEEGENE